MTVATQIGGANISCGAKATCNGAAIELPRRYVGRVLPDGATIGGYRTLRQIGRGGMGAVYLGEHSLLGRRAAIKVLLPSLSSQQEIVQRFFNEARAVTQIADPGIVQVFDFGYDQDGSAYIVMELLEGEPLDQRLARTTRMPPFETVRLARMICMSLHAAHAKGIVHRDLKPENIFLVGDPAVTGGERAKILDFGIAKLSGDEPGALRTRTGMVMGTPVYMSPEQCRGAGEVDHRSDIYSIGCVLMTMLTGSPPFDGTGTGELIAAHMLEDPPRPSSRLPGLSELLDAIVLRCLEKSPADRFQTMRELADALAAAEHAQWRATAVTVAAAAPATLPPVLARPTTLGGVAALSVAAPARRTGLVVSFVSMALAVAAGVAYLATRAGSATAQPPPVIAVPIDAPIVVPVAIDAAPPPPVDAAIDAAPVDAAPVARPHHTKPSGGNHVQAAGSDVPRSIDRGD
jgi:serine/threonine-protein kinase